MLEQLKKAREDKKLLLVDISKSLKINEFYLNALEEKDYHKLPEAVYAIGFIKSYASFLGLDYSEMITQFKKELSDTTCKDIHINTNISCQRSELSKKTMQKLLRLDENSGFFMVKLIIILAIVTAIFTLIIN